MKTPKTGPSGELWPRESSSLHCFIKPAMHPTKYPGILQNLPEI